MFLHFTWVLSSFFKCILVPTHHTCLTVCMRFENLSIVCVCRCTQQTRAESFCMWHFPNTVHCSEFKSKTLFFDRKRKTTITTMIVVLWAEANKNRVFFSCWCRTYDVGVVELYINVHFNHVNVWKKLSNKSKHSLISKCWKQKHDDDKKKSLPKKCPRHMNSLSDVNYTSAVYQLMKSQ